MLEIGSVIFSNISLVLHVIQYCAINMLLSSLFHVYGDFPSQIRYYLLYSFMDHTGFVHVMLITRFPCPFSISLAILLIRCIPCAFIAGPSTFIRGSTHLNCHYQLTPTTYHRTPRTSWSFRATATISSGDHQPIQPGVQSKWKRLTAGRQRWGRRRRQDIDQGQLTEFDY